MRRDDEQGSVELSIRVSECGWCSAWNKTDCEQCGGTGNRVEIEYSEDDVPVWTETHSGLSEEEIEALGTFSPLVQPTTGDGSVCAGCEYYERVSIVQTDETATGASVVVDVKRSFSGMSSKIRESQLEFEDTCRVCVWDSMCSQDCSDRGKTVTR